MSNFLQHAKSLESEGNIAEAIQDYENVIRTENDTVTLADANCRLGGIYREWRELFAAQRFLSQAHQLNPENSDIRDAIESLNLHFTENREEIADQMSRQNSDQIVSLFRIATGIKLIGMDKAVQAYPLLKSRTKIFPNAAVAKHLLTDISITEEERNSAIEYLIERDWLVNTGTDLYTIADSGLYAFYTTLAKLHVDNEVYQDAITCYEQAYWLDSDKLTPLYQKIICYAALESWNEALESIKELPTEVPSEIDHIAYYTATALVFHHFSQQTDDDNVKQHVIDACKKVLSIDKKDKTISKLLDSYEEKKSWWRR